jgi:SecD/SecF fusion protein
MRNFTWRFFLVVFVVLWSLWELYPPTPRPLIDEFNNNVASRDTNFNTMVASAQQAAAGQRGREYGALLTAAGTNDLSRYFPQFKVPAGKDTNRFILNRLQANAAGKIKLGLDLQGGTSFLVGVDTSKIETTNSVGGNDRTAVLEQAIEVLRRRVDKFGVAEPTLQPAGENRILIQMPGLSEADKESAKGTIQRAAFLEFRLVHPESDTLITQGIAAPGFERLTLKHRDKNSGAESFTPVLVKKKAEKGLTGKFVDQAGVSRHPMSGEFQILMRFNSEGAGLFGDITRANVGRKLAIVLDGELYSAPVINEPILGGNAQISGDFDMREALELANVLENPLEAPVKIIEERGVDPSLGKDSIRSGVRASIIGIIFVASFMLIYYLVAGVVANVALLLNVIILLGIMCSVGTTLTLPGIAGIVLTIGMAVDANVLIFERIREELEAGKSLRGAISAGYNRAFGTIFDSNLTTLIASVILIYMGTGPVKGFGVTLTIGIAASMFTALFVTRLFFDFMLEKNMITKLKMMNIVRDTKIDFLKVAKPAFIISWVIILVGLGWGIKRGSGVMGVDFAGGDSLGMRFAQRVEVEQLRNEITKLNVGEPLIQYQQDAAGAGQTLQITTEFETGSKVEQALKTAFPQAKFERVSLDKVGPTVGDEILRTAIIAALLALFGILVYVAFRYEFSFAVGAVIAVLHDVLMTLGIFFLSGRELSAPIVAAVLTIIGFSINDTIVIFDRIREDLKLGMRGSFRDIINRALNQTLSRTIITSGTVFLSTLSLYLFGGGVINDFAFTFLVGIISGTYSTMYIAAAFVLWWHKGEKPKTATNVSIESATPASA